MNFKTKYMARGYLLEILGWAFSFTVLIFVIHWIRMEKLYDFAHTMYPRANLKNDAVVIKIISDYKKVNIYPLYYYLPLTLFVDYYIRKMLQKFVK